MPNEDVRGLEIRTMQFEQAHTGQAGQRAGDQSGRGGADGEPAANYQPAQQSGGDCVEKTSEQACDAGGKEMVGTVIAE